MKAMQTESTGMYTHDGMYAPFALLVWTGCVMAWLLMSENVEAVGYESGIHFFLSHIIYVGLGMALLALIGRLDSTWFDKIGVTLLAVGLVMPALKLFLPQSGDVRDSVVVAGVSVRFSLLVLPGMVWLADYLSRKKAQIPQGILYLIGLGFLVVWGLVFLFDPTMMFLAAMVLLGVIVYCQGFSKIFFVSAFSMGGMLAAMIAASPHAIQRIGAWWENIGIGTAYPQLSGVSLIQEKIGEGIFIYNDWGGVGLVCVGITVLWLVFALLKEKQLFATGVALMFAFDLLLHIVSFLGLTPFRPPVVFGAGHGVLVTVVSFVMLGMVVLHAKEKTIPTSDCEI